MIKILMHGCNGKMGQVVSRLVLEQPNMEIVAGVDVHVSNTNSYPVFTDIHDCTIDADVIIDFSTAAAIPSLLKYIKEKRIPLVLCTTGLSNELVNAVENTSLTTPVFFSANMSLGVNLLMNLAKRATEILADANFDIEIVEKHHNQKIDAPSGTALALADAINETLNHEYQYTYDRHEKRQERNKKEIGIHAVRGGTIVGDHSIIFAGNDEIIELNHTALSKEIFAVGAIKAARFMASKASVTSNGLYNMEDLINS